MDFIFLMHLTGLTWGNLSSHLSTLEEAGYVHIQKQFVEKKSHTMIELTDQGRHALQHGDVIALDGFDQVFGIPLPARARHDQLRSDL